MKNNLLRININLLTLFCGLFSGTFSKNPENLKKPADELQQNTVNTAPLMSVSHATTAEEKEQSQAPASERVKQRIEEVFTEILNDKATKSFELYCEDIITLCDDTLCDNKPEYAHLKKALQKVKCSKNSIAIANTLQPLIADELFKDLLSKELQTRFDKLNKAQLLLKIKRIIR